MSQSPLRRFRVHARHVDSHHARLIDEPSFEAAAVAYLENLDLHFEVGNDREMSIIVHELGTSHEHCFRIDLDTGEASSCS